LVVPLALFMAGTAAATSQDDPFYSDTEAVYAESGVHAGNDGAYAFDVIAAADEHGNTIYYSDGAWADFHGAGTYEVFAGTHHDSAWWLSQGTLASDQGAAAWDEASWVHEGEAGHYGEVVYAEDNGAGVHEELAVVDSEDGMEDHGDAYGHSLESDSDELADTTGSLVKEPATTTATQVADNDEGAPPAHFAQSVDEWVAYGQQSGAATEHGAAYHAAVGFESDEFFAHGMESAAASEHGAAFHQAFITGGED
jgi:hypothetical protein